MKLLEKQKKAAATAANVETQKKPENSKVKEDELDPTQYYEMRKAAIQKMKGSEPEPYPHKFHVSISFADFIAKYSSLEAGQHLDAVEVSVSGKLALEL